MFGPGNVEYYPKIDTGNKLGTKPNLIKLHDIQTPLSPIQCYTRDWKIVKIETLLVYNIFRPVHGLVNIQDPLMCTLVMCTSIIRDACANVNLADLFAKKAQLAQVVKVNYFLIRAKTNFNYYYTYFKTLHE